MTYLGSEISKLTLGLRIANRIIDYSRQSNPLEEVDMYAIILEEFRAFERRTNGIFDDETETIRPDIRR